MLFFRACSTGIRLFSSSSEEFTRKELNRFHRNLGRLMTMRQAMGDIVLSYNKENINPDDVRKAYSVQFGIPLDKLKGSSKELQERINDIEGQMASSLFARLQGPAALLKEKVTVLEEEKK